MRTLLERMFLQRMTLRKQTHKQGKQSSAYSHLYRSKWH